MKIYHGTSSANVDKILLNGITPRGDTESHWDRYPSRDDLVYLSTAYPFYFAHVAAERDGGISVVFEVDLDLLDTTWMLPDEDFISQGIAHNEGKEISDVQMNVRDNLEMYWDWWERSIEGMGNAAHDGTILPYCLTRYCLFDHRLRPMLSAMIMDPTISVLNYMICKEKYLGIVAWLFGDREDIPQGFEAEYKSDDPNMQKQLDERKAYWDEQSKDRTGVEVINLQTVEVG